MKPRWERPKVRSVEALNEVWGTCEDGSTPTDTTCADGQSTIYPDTTTIPHACVDGGWAATYPGCSAGDQVMT